MCEIKWRKCVLQMTKLHHLVFEKVIAMQPLITFS